MFRSRGWTFSQFSIALCIILLAGFNVLLLGRLLVIAKGSPVTVEIDSKQQSFDRHGGSYDVNFHYRSGPETIFDSQHVEQSEYETLQAGQQFPGRAMRFWLWNVCISEAGNPSSQTTSIAWATALGDSGDLIVIWFTLRKRSRIHWLLRQGEACQGTLIDRRFRLTRSSIKHLLKYRFVVSGTLEVTKEDRVTRSAYGSAVLGSPLTVLYDPVQPTRCLAYDYCNYEILM
jgi:hypothetical protein